jgi:hypothetical protein
LKPAIKEDDMLNDPISAGAEIFNAARNIVDDQTETSNGTANHDLLLDPGASIGPQVTPPEPSMDDLLAGNVMELLDRFRNGDPAVMAALRGKDGPAALIKLQDAMNQENRMYTFLSQRLSTEHETAKTIINNIR